MQLLLFCVWAEDRYAGTGSCRQTNVLLFGLEPSTFMTHQFYSVLEEKKHTFVQDSGIYSLHLIKSFIIIVVIIDPKCYHNYRQPGDK